jgi:hypothetical protein
VVGHSVVVVVMLHAVTAVWPPTQEKIGAEQKQLPVQVFDCCTQKIPTQSHLQAPQVVVVLVVVLDVVVVVVVVPAQGFWNVWQVCVHG